MSIITIKSINLFLSNFTNRSAKAAIVAICGIAFVIAISYMLIVDQQVFALASVTQITSVKSGGSDVSNGGTVTIPVGEKTAKITFNYRGFDDNDHIIEFRCSLDGVNYLKSNCPTQSAESQTAFTGPDGVTRTYYVRTGSVQVELPLPPVPKTYTFGVRVINDNGNISPAATWSFRIKSSEGSGSSAGGPADNNSPVEPHDTKVTVKFDSITILKSNDGPLPVGDWFLMAYVQGREVRNCPPEDPSIYRCPILDGKVTVGQTIKFKPGTEATVNLDGNIPLSIFTAGVERDCNGIMEFLTNPFLGAHRPGWSDKETTDLYAKLYSDPNLDWKREISVLQYNMGASMIDSTCYDPNNRLGTVNELYSPPTYKPVKKTYTPEELEEIVQKFPEPLRTHIINALTHPGQSTYVMSSLKDFILKYTVTVEH